VLKGTSLAKLPSHNIESVRSVHSESLINYEVVVSPIAGQTVISPGKLLKQWNEGERAYFHYRTNQPIRNTFGLVLGKYKRYQDKYNDVEINIYHHPKTTVTLSGLPIAPKRHWPILKKTCHLTATNNCNLSKLRTDIILVRILVWWRFQKERGLSVTIATQTPSTWFRRSPPTRSPINGSATNSMPY
jgi:hypothetical protein